MAHGADPIIIGNTIIGNTSSHGGGIRCYDASMVLMNNTIALNSSYEGGGIASHQNSTGTITNTIVWNNHVGGFGEEITIGSSSTINISYSDVKWGQDSVSIDTTSTLNWGEGMIDDDPLFLFPEKPDCRLLWESPCIDTGHPDSLDADGTRSDMGSYFFNQDDYLTLYLTPDTTDVEQGSQLGVTYTAINRWAQPEVTWLLTQVILPDGYTANVLGPNMYTMPAENTVQVNLVHNVPLFAPAGAYQYWSVMGLPPTTLYDYDCFMFEVIEPVH